MSVEAPFLHKCCCVKSIFPMFGDPLQTTHFFGGWLLNAKDLSVSERQGNLLFKHLIILLWVIVFHLNLTGVPPFSGVVYFIMPLFCWSELEEMTSYFCGIDIFLRIQVVDNPFVYGRLFPGVNVALGEKRDDGIFNPNSGGMNGFIYQTSNT